MRLEINKKYLTRDGRECIVTHIDAKGKIATTHWGSKVWADSGEVIRDKKSDGDIVALWDEGPVRTVTRREIVPGVYGRVNVGRKGDGAGFTKVPVSMEYLFYSAEELREAAHLFNQLAEALNDA